MSARLLEGRPVAEAIWRDVEQRAQAFETRGATPPCVGLIAGADGAAAAYASQIERQFTRHGLRVLSRSVGATALLEQVASFNADPGVDGILVLTPLPAGIQPEAAMLAIDPAKDVDGQHPINLGRLAQRRSAFAPATALGGLRLLQHYAIPLRGARAVVVGRSPVVGMPLALLLVDADASVTVCHSRSEALGSLTREAEVLCVAAGREHLIGPRDVRPGAVVLDFGTHPTASGSLLGDVHTAAVAEVAAAITPVPGGTGPTTVAVLAQQTVVAAELRRTPDE